MSTEHVMIEDCLIVHETESAILIEHEYLDDDEQVWIPRSQIESIKQNGRTAKIYMSAWIAEAKGLI